MRTRVFVSYRRNDTRHAAGRLRDRLADAFGEESVFFDVYSIEFGLDFRTVIRDSLRTVDAVLTVIGPAFDPARLARHDDYVRLELLEALRQDKLIVPVLVDEARIPAPDELPSELESLSYRSAAVLRPDPDFGKDVGRLVESLRRNIKSATAVAAPTELGPVKASAPARKAARAGPPRTPADALRSQGFYTKVSDRIFYNDATPRYRIVLLRASVRLERRQTPPYQGREWQWEKSFPLSEEGTRRAVAAIPTRAKTPSTQTVDSKRKRFVRDIQDHGFHLGAGSKHVYYHRNDPYPERTRIRIDKDRIRFEDRPDRISEWQLVRSFRLVDELDAALATIDLVKPKRRR